MGRSGRGRPAGSNPGSKPGSYAGSVVAAVVAQDTHPFELSVACEVFGLGRPELGVPWYEFRVVAADPPPIRLGSYTMVPPFGLDALTDAGTIIVPAGLADRSPSPELVDAIRAADVRGARLVSFCS